MGGNVCAWNENKQEGNINKQERKRKQTKAVPGKSLRLYILLRISWRIRFKSHRSVTRITLRSRRPRCRMGCETKTLSFSPVLENFSRFSKKKKEINRVSSVVSFLINERKEKRFQRFEFLVIINLIKFRNGGNFLRSINIHQRIYRKILEEGGKRGIEFP